MISYTQNPCKKAEDSVPGPAARSEGQVPTLCQALRHSFMGFHIQLSLEFILQLRKLKLRDVESLILFSQLKGRKLDCQPQICLASKLLQHWLNDHNSFVFFTTR